MPTVLALICLMFDTEYLAQFKTILLNAAVRKKYTHTHTPSYLTLFIFKYLFHDLYLWTLKWIRKKVSFKAWACSLKNDFFFPKPKNQSLESKTKFMWHFAGPPIPLECRVLIEWLLNAYILLKLSQGNCYRHTFFPKAKVQCNFKNAENVRILNVIVISSNSRYKHITKFL